MLLIRKKLIIFSMYPCFMLIHIFGKTIFSMQFCVCTCIHVTNPFWQTQFYVCVFNSIQLKLIDFIDMLTLKKNVCPQFTKSIFMSPCLIHNLTTQVDRTWIIYHGHCGVCVCVFSKYCNVIFVYDNIVLSIKRMPLSILLLWCKITCIYLFSS